MSTADTGSAGCDDNGTTPGTVSDRPTDTEDQDQEHRPYSHSLPLRRSPHLPQGLSFLACDEPPEVQIHQEDLEKNGLCPRVRSKVVPHNTTKLSDIQHVVRFILQYADDNAILLPGRISGYKRDDLQLLPSSTTKRQVWETYHQSSLAAPDVKGVCYSLFCDLWNQLTPQVAVTRPMSDLCWVCQHHHAGPQQTCGGEVRGTCHYTCIIYNVCVNTHSCTCTCTCHTCIHTGTKESRATPATSHPRALHLQG